MAEAEWIVQVNDMLYNDDDESRRAHEYAIPRVATPLRKTSPEAYIPKFVSIGPYHHSILEKDIESSCPERKISTAETYKAKAAATLSQKLRKRGKSFKSIVDLMEEMRPDIDRFYHWPATGSNSTTTEVEERPQNFALMMAVDSSFLLDFISRYISRKANYSLYLDPLQVCIKSDILKLENQIPLTVLRRVFEYKREASEPEDLNDLNDLLLKACRELSPFEIINVSDNHMEQYLLNEAAPKKHLLYCMHAFVSPILKIQQEEKELELTRWQIVWQILKLILVAPVIWVALLLPSPSFERMYEIVLNAEKLVKNGIKFKSLSEQHKTIGMDSYSGTLYLPRIYVFEMYTEVLLRNLVALEYNDASRGTAVMRYVGIMDSLIQTPEDVRVLRRHHIIATDTVADECIAKMWKDLVRPFFTGQVKLAPDSSQLGRGLYLVLSINYHKSKISRMVGGLYDYASNWKWVAFVGGLVGLTISATQTYFSWYALHHSPPH